MIDGKTRGSKQPEPMRMRKKVLGLIINGVTPPPLPQRILRDIHCIITQQHAQTRWLKLPIFLYSLWIFYLLIHDQIQRKSNTTQTFEFKKSTFKGNKISKNRH